MQTSIKHLLAITLGLTLGANALAQVDHPLAILPLASEPDAKLVVYPPQPGALARGVVILQFRTENLRVLPVFGAKAIEDSPRIGHLHITVDDRPGTWAHTSNDPVIIAGLPPGTHKIQMELADPNHKVIGGETVSVTVPDTRSGKS